MCSTGTGKQERNAENLQQHQERVANISFARQIMAGDRSSLESEEELDSGVWEYER